MQTSFSTAETEPWTLILGPAAALLSSLTWAIGTSVYSRLSRHYPAFLVNFHRAFVAFWIFALLLFSSKGAGFLFQVEPWRYYWFLISVVCSYAFADVLFFWSTRSVGAPGALAIASTYPIWACAAGWALHGQALRPRAIAGLVLTVIGTVTVILSGRPKNRTPKSADSNGPRSPSDRYAIGVLLAGITSGLWALNAFAVSLATRDLPVEAAGTARMFMAATLSLVFGAIWTWNDESSRIKRVFLPWPELRRSGWVFVLEGFGGAWLYTYGLGHTPLALGAILSSLAPVLAIPIAWKFGGERIAFAKFLGVGVVVVGVWLLLTPG